MENKSRLGPSPFAGILAFQDEINRSMAMVANSSLRQDSEMPLNRTELTGERENGPVTSNVSLEALEAAFMRGLAQGIPEGADPRALLGDFTADGERRGFGVDWFSGKVKRSEDE